MIINIELLSMDRQPVIVHTNSLVDTADSCDSAYDSKSDSETSNSSDMVVDTSSRSVICKWIDCGRIFQQLDELAAHVTSYHANSGPGGLFFCGWEGCNRGNRGFNARYKMLVHVRTHTNEKPHRCCQCDKSFSRAENLKIHARSHTGERPYACPIPGCGKAYSNSSDRFKHTRTHQVDKPYICKVPGCNKRYTDPSSLRKHVKTYRHFPEQNIEKTRTTIDENIERKPKENDTIAALKIRENSNFNNNFRSSAFQRIYYPDCDFNTALLSNEVPNIEQMELGNFVANELSMEEIKNRVNYVKYNFFQTWLNENRTFWKSDYTKEESSIRRYYDVIEQDTPLDLSLQKP